MSGEGRAYLAALRPRLEALKDWTQAALEDEVRAFADGQSPELKLGKIAQPLRASLTGSYLGDAVSAVVTHCLQEALGVESAEGDAADQHEHDAGALHDHEH